MSYKLSIESTAILLSCVKQLTEVAKKEHDRALEQKRDKDETHAIVQLLDYLHDTAGELETITKEMS